LTTDRPLEIVLAASEAYPYAKTGGLADVAGSLAVKLAALGCRVHLFHPCYRTTLASFDSLETAVGSLEVDRDAPPGAVFRHTPAPGATAWLLAQGGYFDRPGIYGDEDGDYPDNDRRFGWFCRAVLKAMERLNIRPDVLHCHDWQTALLPLYLRQRPDLAGPFAGVPTLLTIHNLAYQGLFPRDSLAALGIPESAFSMEGVEFYGQVNVLKGGIVSADALNTVSRRYSREIQTPEFGAGLEEVLRGRSDSLHGILNGIDTDVWNPASDPYLPANYSAANLSGKAVCKKALLDTFALPHEAGIPLMATIARLVDQKGFDLIAEVLPDFLAAGAQYILLGSGEGRYLEIFTSLAAEHPGRMAVKIAYDEALSHRIEAGADFFLMPSRFEPCGLNQMYSLRYGTIPVVRATGGLDDTIVNYDPATGKGNGLKFEEYTSEALSLKLHEALLAYRRKEHMKKLVTNAMEGDFSWARAAAEYIALYRALASL
jgi:starch synthase